MLSRREFLSLPLTALGLTGNKDAEQDKRLDSLEETDKKIIEVVVYTGQVMNHNAEAYNRNKAVTDGRLERIESTIFKETIKPELSTPTIPINV